jgi:hypothetical protein
MVYEYRNIMTLIDIFAHIDILRRKRRGIQPELIEYSPLNGGATKPEQTIGNGH